MRQQVLFLLAVAFLEPACTNDSSGSSSSDGSTAAASCTSLCPEVPYGVCVERDAGVGHCVAWNSVGATPCQKGPSDCPSTDAGIKAKPPAAAPPEVTCVREYSFEFVDDATDAGPSDLGQGYCGAYLSTTSVTTCSNQPCGPHGYCSTFTTAAGDAGIGCFWPL
jgi:hypothetical protein